MRQETAADRRSRDPAEKRGIPKGYHPQGMPNHERYRERIMAKSILHKRPSGRKTPVRRASGMSRLMAEVRRLDKLILSPAWRESLREAAR